jgi:hypothetical protein
VIAVIGSGGSLVQILSPRSSSKEALRRIYRRAFLLWFPAILIAWLGSNPGQVFTGYISPLTVNPRGNWLLTGSNDEEVNYAIRDSHCRFAFDYVKECVGVSQPRQDQAVAPALRTRPPFAFGFPSGRPNCSPAIWFQPHHQTTQNGPGSLQHRMKPSRCAKRCFAVSTVNALVSEGRVNRFDLNVIAG